MSNEGLVWIINEINTYDQFSKIEIEKIVDIETGYAYIIADFLKSKKYKIAALRKSFDYIKRVERIDKGWNDKKIEFYLLKPRLAMSVGKKQIPKEVYDVIIAAMNLVDVNDIESKNLNNFKYFIYFLESIIAYHRFLGGS